MTESVPLLEMNGIVKRFPGVIANDDISLSIRRGEIHGLLGENGAGKSTLMKILYGLYSADEGEVIFKGEAVDFDSPDDAIARGIAMVHQHFMLIPKFTVQENIILGEREPADRYNSENEHGMVDTLVRLFSLGKSRPRQRIEAIQSEYGLSVDPDVKVWELDVGEQQRVEILKALYRDAELLILDEPTAVLTPDEAEDLFESLRQFTDDGKSIIFITHKLNEIKSITDRVTVLRDGKHIDTVDTKDVTQADMARMMVGREVLFDVDKEELATGAPVLEVSNLDVMSDRGVLAVSDVNLTIHEGEILGIAGVSGNGQKELAEALVGLRSPHAGTIVKDGSDLTEAKPRKFVENDISYVPDDRLKYGCAPGLDVMRNTILKEYRSDQFGQYLSMDYEAAKSYTEGILDEYDVRGAPDVSALAGGLSGGNLQKLILGREIHRDPDVMIANQPTRGVDVGSIEYLRKLILEQQKRGTGTLLISEDLDELFDLSDRLLVMYEGEFVHETTPEEITKEQIGLRMTGALDNDTQKTDNVTGEA